MTIILGSNSWTQGSIALILVTFCWCWFHGAQPLNHLSCRCPQMQSRFYITSKPLNFKVTHKKNKKLRQGTLQLSLKNWVVTKYQCFLCWKKYAIETRLNQKFSNPVKQEISLLHEAEAMYPFSYEYGTLHHAWDVQATQWASLTFLKCDQKLVDISQTFEWIIKLCTIEIRYGNITIQYTEKP